MDAVILMEQFADGKVSRHQVREIYRKFEPIHNAIAQKWQTAHNAMAQQYPNVSTDLIAAANRYDCQSRVSSAIFWLLHPLKHLYLCMHSAAAADKNGERAGLLKQSDLVREIWGNPFHKVRLGGISLKWRGNTIVQLATRIYEDRDFTALPIVADALDEAGCTDTVLLEHLRGPSNHVCGCWALDVLRRK